jgi:RNA polymerase sigma-70 factor (ECF subfamily)
MLEQSRVPHSPDAASGLQSKRAVDSVQSFSDLPDLLLVERTRGRDTRAFETLMRRYNRRLYRIARSILSNDDMAEEAVRAAYIRAFANLDRYEPAGKFGAWLARLAFNEALTLRRHSPGAVPLVATSAAAEAVPAGEGSDAVASRQQLEDAIDALPEVFRTVLVLRVVEDLSGVEVAVCLGLNETTVRTRLYRAQQRLKVDVARRLRAEPFNIFDLSTERCDRIVGQVFSKVHAVSPVVSDAR